MSYAIFEPGDLVVPDMSNMLGEQLAHSGFILGEVVARSATTELLIHHLIDTNSKRAGLEIFCVSIGLKKVA